MLPCYYTCIRTYVCIYYKRKHFFSLQKRKTVKSRSCQRIIFLSDPRIENALVFIGQVLTARARDRVLRSDNNK